MEQSRQNRGDSLLVPRNQILAQAGPSLKSFMVLGLGIVGITFLYIFNPSESNFGVSCLFHSLTGFHCPGCGSSRALHQLLHGHLATAFGLNALMVLSLPFLGYSFLSYIVNPMSRRALPNIFVPAILIWVLLGGILLFSVLRNIPFYPFSLLAP